ncbi:hypothetical protein V8C44DRAFT_81674 [Trichoderma aethiopicum]
MRLCVAAAPPPPRICFRLSCFCCSHAEPRLSLFQSQSQSVNQTVSRRPPLQLPTLCQMYDMAGHKTHQAPLHDGFCASLSRLVPRCRSPSESRPRQACGLVSIRSSCRWQSSRHMRSIAGDLSSALSHGNALAARSHATEQERRRQARRCEPKVLVLIH